MSIQLTLITCLWDIHQWHPSSVFLIEWNFMISVRNGLIKFWESFVVPGSFNRLDCQNLNNPSPVVNHSLSIHIVVKGSLIIYNGEGGSCSVGFKKLTPPLSVAKNLTRPPPRVDTEVSDVCLKTPLNKEKRCFRHLPGYSILVSEKMSRKNPDPTLPSE